MARWDINLSQYDSSLQSITLCFNAQEVAQISIHGPVAQAEGSNELSVKDIQIMAAATWSNPRRGMLLIMTVASNPRPVRKPAHSRDTSGEMIG